MGVKEFLIGEMPPGKWTNLGLLFMRLIFGSTMAVNYGWPVFSAVLKGEFGFPDPLGIGAAASSILMGTAEFICAILVVLGLGTRLATIPLIFGLGVAFFIFHSEDPFQAKELAFLYGSIFSSILVLGPGMYSLDRKIFN